MARKNRVLSTERHPAYGELKNMRYPDLKRAVIIRGMDFDEVINGDYFKLSSYFRDHYYDNVNTELLDEFDDYLEGEIIKKSGFGSKNPLIHPTLRLGFILEMDDRGNVTKTKRVRGIRKKRKKSERTQDGLISGTKKSYTYELEKQGYDKKEVIQMVKEKYPDAKEKSIGIWYNKSKKLTNNGCSLRNAKK